MAILPPFDSAAFEAGAPIDNPFFPVRPGTIRSFSGSFVDEETGETGSESNDVFATFETKEIAGVQTIVVRDTAYADGVLVEDTLDWYAQDQEGNVWYLGEIAYNYEYDDAGNWIETNNDGSWEAGVDGAQPGWIMRAEPGFGAAYFQEFAPGIAEDEGIVVATNQEVEIGLGAYEGVLKTLDTTALEPDIAEFKYYAPGEGQIRADEDLDENGDPRLVVELTGVREVARDDDEAGEDDDGDAVALAAVDDVVDDEDTDEDHGAVADATDDELVEDDGEVEDAADDDLDEDDAGADDGEVDDAADDLDEDDAADDLDEEDGEDDAGEDDEEDGAEVDFPLGDLADGQALAGVELADDPEPDDFVGDLAAFTVTFLADEAGYNNALGGYAFDLATGEIGEGRILFAESDAAAAGEQVEFALDDGQGLGLFLIPNVEDLGIDLSQFEDGGLFFRDVSTGEAATLEDGLAPLVLNEDGDPMPIQALHALGNDDGFNFLNPAAGVQAVELDSGLVPDDDFGFETIVLGFEDLRATQAGRDDDFNDLVVAVSDGGLAPDLLGGLLGELGTADALLA